MVVKKAAVSTRVEKYRDKVLKLSKVYMYLP